MEKIDIRDLSLDKRIYDGESSSVYDIGSNMVAKIVKPIVLSTCAIFGTGYENKILDTRSHEIKEIISPTGAIYSKKTCVGYTMRKTLGIDLKRFDKNFSLPDRNNLYKYAILFHKIEEVIKKAHKLDIIMPDLCTCDNIILNEDGSLSFIDYDGMQIGDKDVSVAVSTSLGDPMKYLTKPKYSKKPFTFTKELDKTSLTYLLFMLVFNIDLNKVGQKSPDGSGVVTLKDVFKVLNIRDMSFMTKVLLNTSDSQNGVFLSNDLDRIAQNYDMVTVPVGNDQYLKSLRHK